MNWNWIDLEIRTTELIEHHIQRCEDILQSLRGGPKRPEEIVEKCFKARLLKGFGSDMALNEVLSHCELLALSGDIVLEEGGGITATHRTGFESLIRDLG